MMSIFSASPSICGSLSGTRVFHSSFHLLFPRVSVVSCSFSARSSRRCYSCVVYSSKVRARTELVEAKESNETSCALERLEVPSSESRVDEEVGHSRTFLNARSEEELITGIRKEVVAGRLPSDVATRMEEIYQNYSNAILQSGSSKASDIILSNIAVAFDRMLLDVETYVAGDRVVTEPVCKPFSMGRNLVCVYSKKHRYDIPQLAEMKKRSNTRSLKEMALLLRTGAPIIWIAPSGGRDRPDPSSGEWYPAPFDVSSVDNMRRLLDHAGVPGHIHPVALLCHDIMPPPCQAEKEIGERRMISYHGVGLSVAPEISFSEIAVELKNLMRLM